MNLEQFSANFAHETSVLYLKTSSSLTAFFTAVFTITLAILHYFTPYATLFDTISVLATTVTATIVLFFIGSLVSYTYTRSSINAASQQRA
ncbi:hypothetical protein [Sulfurimonas sp. HSL3-2]|uniref:hypothetical protein n=1 Tax=Hydrocurvibacter mobilis TaxID=3131936 RepID=UPI0031F922A4